MCSSIKNLSMVFFVLCFVVQAKAEFVLDKDYCFLSTSFSFQNQGKEVMGLFQMAYSSPPVILPIMNISFSGDFKPEDVSISWKSAKLTNKNNQALFEQNFTRELNSSERVFPFYRNGGEVYYSPAYGFLNFKIFMAMFLSQNNMELNFKDSKGEVSQILISLAGSDQTFRSMAIECYKDKSVEYLNEHTTRKKGLAESWATAYGLLNYEIASNLQETHYVLREEFQTDITKSYDFYASLYPLLQQKGELLEQLLEVETQSTVSETLTVIKEKTSAIENKQARMNELKMTDRGGLIQSTRDEVLRLQRLLLELEGQIKQLREDKIIESESSLNDIQESNAILVAELEVIDQNISDLDQSINSSTLTLQRLYEAYTYIGAKIQESDLLRIQEMQYAGPPLSIEAIEEQMSKVSELEMEILILEMSLGTLKELEPVLSLSLEQYQTAMSSYREQLLTQREITSLKFAIQQLQIEKRKKEDEVGLPIHTLKDTNKIIEAKTAQERTLDEEKTAIINQLREVNTEFDGLLDEVESRGLLILPQIACHSNIFRADVNEYCLTPQDLLSEAEIAYFFENMSSSRIDAIIIRSQMDYSYPWRGEGGKNKVQTLSEKLAQELRTEDFSKLDQIWNQILTYRWRYNQVRNLNIDKVTSKTYDDFIKTLQNELNTMDQNVSSKSRELRTLESRLLEQQHTYLGHETAYNLAVDEFSEKFRQTFGEDAASPGLDSCLRNLFDISSCQNEYQQYVTLREQEQQQKKSEYQSDVEGLMLMVSSGIRNTSEFKQDSEARLARVKEQRGQFLEASKLEDLLLEQESMSAAHQKLLNDLEALEERSENLETEKTAKVLETERFTNEYSRLESETAVLRTELSSLASTLDMYCSEQGHLYESISQINQQIINMGGVINEAQSFVSPCQTIKNMVLR